MDIMDIFFGGETLSTKGFKCIIKILNKNCINDN